MKNRIAINETMLLEKISNVRDSVDIAYPMGLPEYDLVKISLDSDTNLDVSDV